MALRRSFSFTRRKKEDKTPTKEPPKSPFQEDQGLTLAMKMIDKEHELEKNCSALTVNELITIYSEAIEYYSQKNDQKYLDLQNRMHRILIRPDVIASLKKENTKTPSEFPKFSSQDHSKPPKSASKPQLKEISPATDSLQVPKTQASEKKSVLDSLEDSQEHKTRARRSRSFDGELDLQHLQAELKETSEKFTLGPKRHNTEIQNSTLSERLLKSLNNPPNKNLNIIIDRHAKTNKTTAVRAAADFKSQDSALERRLASRQKIKLTQSMSFTSCNSRENPEAFKCDLSEVYEEGDFSTKSSCFVVEEQADESEKFEKVLEEIMEKNYLQRAAKVAEIKLKYETQIGEIAGMGEGMKVLVEEMKRNMKEEIEVVVKEFDLKRKEQIAEIKAMV